MIASGDAAQTYGQAPLDPLSEVLALMQPETCMAGGFGLNGDLAIEFPKHTGVKCYALLSGRCFLVLDGMQPVELHAGDCFLLPHGRPFVLTTDLKLEPVNYRVAMERGAMQKQPQDGGSLATYMAGGFFAFTGTMAEMILKSLPPVVRLHSEPDKAAIRQSIERMREELANPQPGSALMAQHLAHGLLIQALRLHLAEQAASGSGWLFALTDPQLSRVIAAIHEDPAAPWTVQSLAERAGMSRSVFASRFQAKVGTTPVEYLTRWRMLLAANRLKHSAEGTSTIAQSLGYDSESAFGKAFRRVMGTSPRRYARAPGSGAYTG